MNGETMTPARMLELLALDGANAASDYNDDDRVDGWFGWTINDLLLTVTYRPCAGDGRPGEAQTASWRLVADPHDGESCEDVERHLDSITGDLNEISLWLARLGASPRQPDGTWDYLAALRKLAATASGEPQETP